jgi:pimeloyl-ACP methyl ester carboxylesterase
MRGKAAVTLHESSDQTFEDNQDGSGLPHTRTVCPRWSRSVSADEPPAFVMVHGAFHGGWCWAPLARILRARGYEVFTPTLTGLGERAHLLSPAIDMETFVRDVLGVLECEELTDVILVGHSYGARTITGVADRVPHRIRRLIYIDGGLPLDGRSRLDAMSADARESRIASSMRFDGGISVPPPSASRFDIQELYLREWVERRLTPQPLNAERTVLDLKNEIGNGLPATYVHCVNPSFAGVDRYAKYARERPDWRYLQFAGGHDSFLTHPTEMATLLIGESGRHMPSQNQTPIK